MDTPAKRARNRLSLWCSALAMPSEPPAPEAAPASCSAGHGAGGARPVVFERLQQVGTVRPPGRRLAPAEELAYPRHHLARPHAHGPRGLQAHPVQPGAGPQRQAGGVSLSISPSVSLNGRGRAACVNGGPTERFGFAYVRHRAIIVLHSSREAAMGTASVTIRVDRCLSRSQWAS